MFKGLANLGNLGQMLKQAQQMGSRLQGLNDELKQKRATGSAGGGLVEIDVNGLAEALAVRIDPSLFAKGDREMVEDLVLAAINAAQAKARQLHAEAMQGMTAGLDMAGFEDAISKITGGGSPPPPASP